ncbi:hypothetical protein ABZY09_30525 [Streptomyces sp. NPDC002928]|uniref:hypothetical protein n=1 Tax=Streptomyces sp. NPDC002928 TaxID=3154440 RepID=UPI0033B8C085
MSAQSELIDFLYGGPSPTGTREGDADYWFDKFAHELAEKIQDAMEETRAADWGRSSRTKRPYLQGMERARKAITREVLNSGG